MSTLGARGNSPVTAAMLGGGYAAAPSFQHEQEATRSPLLLCVLTAAAILTLGLLQSNKASGQVELIAGQAAVAVLAIAFVVFGLLGAGWHIKMPLETLLSVLFVVWALIGIFVAEEPSLLLQYYVSLVKMVALYVVFVNMVRTRKIFFWLAGAYVVTVLCFFVIGAKDLRAEEGTRAVGTTGDPNGLATYAIIAGVCAMVCFHVARRRFVKTLCLLAIPIFMWLVVNSGSRSGLGGVVLVSLGAYWWYIRERVRDKGIVSKAAGLAVGAVVIASVLYIVMSGPFWYRIQKTFGVGEYAHTGGTLTSEARVNLVVSGVKLMAHHPLVGVGYFQYRMSIGEVNPSLVGMVSHNTWIEAGCGTGVPGLLLWLGAYVVLTHRILKLRKNPRLNPIDRGVVALCMVFMAFWWFRSMFFIHLGDKIFLPLVGGITGYLSSLSREYAPAPAASAPLLGLRPRLREVASGA